MRRSRVASRIGFGFESDDSDELNEDLTGEETVEGELIEVDEASQEVEVEEEAIEELEDASEGLESIATSLEAAIEDGGLNAQAADFANKAVNAYTQRLGLSSPLVSSVESFGSTDTRLRATQVSYENIKDSLKAIWEQIVKIVMNVVNKVRDYWFKVWDAAPRLKKRAEKIREKAGKTSGSIEDKKVDGPLRQLHIGGRAPNNFPAAIDGVADIARALLSPSKDATVKLIELFTTGVDQVADNAGSAAKYVSATGGDTLYAQRVGSIPGGSHKFTGKRFTDMVVTGTGELPGGKAIVVQARNSTLLADVATSMRDTVIDFSDKPKDVDSTGDFDTLSTAQVEKVCDSVAVMSEAVMDFRRAYEKRDAAVRKLKEAGAKATKSIEKNDDLTGDERRAAVKIVRAISRVITNSLTGTQQTNNYYLSVGRAALTVCERSLSAHK